MTRPLRMKLILIAVMHVACFSEMLVAGEENPLKIWASLFQNQSTNGHPLVALTGFYKQAAGRHLIEFRLTNLSKKPLTLRPSRLPWGNPHSITLAAVTTDGQRLFNRYEIADPPIFEKPITIATAESLVGEYELERGLDFSHAPRNKDILILWAYHSRMLFDSDDDTSICTGVAVIRKK